MKNAFLRFGAVAAVSTIWVAAACGAIRATTPTAWHDGKPCWQLDRHNEKMKLVAEGGAKIVFIGDSITHFWESNGKAQLAKYFPEGETRMLDLGTAADRTEHVLWRLENGELDGYEAQCVLLMIGTNNAGHFAFENEPPSDAILGIRAILEQIRAKQPKAVIVLTSIFPRGADAADPTRRRNDTVNHEIKRFCDGKTILWCDPTDLFLNADGTLSEELFPDLLHPSALGYEIWYKAVKPYIDYALSDRTGPVPPVLGAKSEAKTRTTVAESRIRREGYGEKDWWLNRLQRNRNVIADSETKTFDLVLFGDSITHNWENSQGKVAFGELCRDYTVLSLGYSGDRTENLIWRGENGELDGFKTKCVMLMIGTNNTGHRMDPPEEIAAGIKGVLDVIAKKQPEAKVLLLPIFPRGVGPTDAQRVNNAKVNELIKPYADGKRIIWLDFTDRFLDQDGGVKWIMPDCLHPGPAGYAIWLEAIRPYLKDICGK